MSSGILNGEKWSSMPFVEQMANIGSEVGRTSKWVQKNKQNMAESAFLRALDLIDLTIMYGRLNSPLRSSMLKELCRVRESFCGAYESSDTTTLEWLDKYFSVYALAQRRNVMA